MGPLAQSASAKQGSTATRNASVSASSGTGAPRSTWAALRSTMQKPKRASASMCRSRISAEEKGFPLRGLGIQCCRFGHRASCDGTAKECVDIDVVVPQLDVCQESEASDVAKHVQCFRRICKNK